MLTMLKNWKGSITVDGVEYTSIDQFTTNFKPGQKDIHIVLHPVKMSANTTVVKPESVEDKKEYRITVKQYMTKKSSPEFDFMAKWNNDNPMPFRTMTGTVEKETKGMVYMKLHGDMWAEKISVCMCCGRALTNPVSQYFGIGPECGHHNYVNPFDSKEELKAAVDAYKKELRKVTWEGWIIRSSIISKEVVGKNVDSE